MRAKVGSSQNQAADEVVVTSVDTSTPSHAVWTKRCAAILFGVVAALAVAELGFRLSNSALPRQAEWQDRPHLFYLPEKAHKRDQVHEIAKATGTFRIIVIGDSFTEPGENQYDDVFSKRLERMLNLNTQQRPVQVLNWGVPGYSTAQEYQLVRRAIADYQPDLILLQITLNDPELAPYRAIHAEEAQLGFFDFLLSSWESFAFVRQRVENSLSRRAYVKYYFDLFEQPDTWANFKNAATNISRVTKSANVPLMAVLFPLFSHPLDDSYPFAPLHKKVTGLLDELSVKQLDLFSSYRGIPPERLQVRPGKDSHPNEIAHRIAADRIYRAAEEFGLLPADVLIKRLDKRREAHRRQELLSAGSSD